MLRLVVIFNTTKHFQERLVEEINLPSNLNVTKLFQCEGDCK